MGDPVVPSGFVRWFGTTIERYIRRTRQTMHEVIWTCISCLPVKLCWLTLTFDTTVQALNSHWTWRIGRPWEPPVPGEWPRPPTPRRCSGGPPGTSRVCPWWWWGRPSWTRGWQSSTWQRLTKSTWCMSALLIWLLNCEFDICLRQNINEVCDICTNQIVSLSLVIREGYIIHE